jgi:ABC-type bacteriocin/lantibiotic exporter with double-glycine peptidase domain
LFDTPTTLVLSDVRNRSIILAIYVGASIIIDIVVFFLVNYISSNCARYMRLAVFKKVNKLSIEKIYSITVPSLISRTIEDCKIAETGIQSVLGVGLIAPITMVGGIVFLFVKFSNHANF